jgi:hypothetical protein
MFFRRDLPLSATHLINTKNMNNKMNSGFVHDRDKSMKISLNVIRRNSESTSFDQHTGAGLQICVPSEHMPDGIRFHCLSTG